MSNELEAVQHLTASLEGVTLRDPQKILDDASERCQILTKMVEQTKSFTQIGPGRHLRVEAWVTLGHFYGCTGRISKTEDIQIGDVLGFKAHAQVIHDATGNILSEADAICMKDEDNWNEKPLHQIMSMAQTRALSKALAAKFRWVVVLGGWAATPAEEMSDRDGGNNAHRSAEYSVKIPFGRAKGKLPNDASIATQDLLEYKTYFEAAVKDETKKKYWKSNRELLDGVNAELLKREQPSSPPDQPDTQEKPAASDAMDDETWEEYCALQQDMVPDQFLAVIKEFKFKDVIKAHPSKRAKFIARMKELVEK